MDKTVIELFAGVGGFRVGLNNITRIDNCGRAIEDGEFKIVWANQWEPSTKSQHAFNCYVKRFESNNDCSNVDISLVDKKSIPDHTLLCGGFPCQDYSVAHSLSKEKGIEGKKGVLWWQINEILKEKKPPFVLLENVDRLLKSPAKQRGRDFAIMLRCFYENGYSVEWRVINAADYGYPQRRRRVYIFAFRKSTKYFKHIKSIRSEKIISDKGIFAEKFPINYKCNIHSKIDLVNDYSDLVDISNRFTEKFYKAGIMINGIVDSFDIITENEQAMTLGQICEKTVDDYYYLTPDKIKKFEYLRSYKRIPRIKPNGEKYMYSEGSMSKVDSLSMPGRTMLTSEGTTNRSTHIIDDGNGIRILTPIECERMNQFPDNWTNCMPERKRYFMMGNALVCGVIKRIGESISQIIDEENK